MKKSLLATTFVAFPLSTKTTRLRTYGCVAIVLLAGCTATQTRWDATNIRKEVMVYYNDEIMDNLIKAKKHLPFVHVDITLLTSQGSSQISGTIGAGETSNNTSTQQKTHQTVTTNTAGATVSHAVAGTVGVVATITHMATRPFTYSVTPQQTETLSIQAAPALGSQAVAAPLPTESPKMQLTKRTKTKETTYPSPSPTTAPPITKDSTTTEEQPTQRTIYNLYDDFARYYVKEEPTRPNKDDVLPGTVIKLWDGHYYYINKNAKNPHGENAEDAYYEFCQALFTKGQSQTGGLERALQQTQAAAALPTR